PHRPRDVPRHQHEVALADGLAPAVEEHLGVSFPPGPEDVHGLGLRAREVRVGDGEQAHRTAILTGPSHHAREVRSTPEASTRASISSTLSPVTGCRQAGSASRSGTSTKALWCRRGCGTVATGS